MALNRHSLALKLRRILPSLSILRILLGIVLVIGGMLGFLPILGFWMIPLGVIVLSLDIPPLRRFRRKFMARRGKNRSPRRNGLEEAVPRTERKTGSASGEG